MVVAGAPAATLSQMQLYGADLCQVRGFGKDPAVTAGVFSTLRDLAAQRNIPLPVSAYCFCPEGMQGVETLAQRDWLIAHDCQVMQGFLVAPGLSVDDALAFPRTVDWADQDNWSE